MPSWERWCGEWNEHVSLFSFQMDSIELISDCCQRPRFQVVSDAQIVFDAQLGGWHWSFKHLLRIHYQLFAKAPWILGPGNRLWFQLRGAVY